MKEETGKIHDLQIAISVNYVHTTAFLAETSLAIQTLLAGSSSPSEQINTLQKNYTHNGTGSPQLHRVALLILRFIYGHGSCYGQAKLRSTQ
jgi:hypothetical protein